MSWHTLTHDPTDGANIWLSVRVQRPARSLGNATADARWRWASPNVGYVTPPVAAAAAAAPAAPSAARELRAEMAEMARVLGRSEDDIWAEAAREWLIRRLRNDEPPPTTPAAASVPGTRPSRMWSEIDVMLAELRHPRYVAASVAPAIPAA